MRGREREVLLDAMAALGEGDLSVRLDPTSGDGEFDGLAERFNGMAEALQRRFESQAHDLNSSEQSYRELFNSATDMIFVQDPATGAFIDVNEETLRMTGFSLDEFIRHGPELFSPKTPDYAPEKAMEHIGRAVAGEPQLFEWAFVDKDGVLHPTEVHLKRVELNGRDCLLGICRDITERKQAREERLALEKKMLQAQKLESLGLLAGGIAHDFNNILMGIMGHAGLALLDLAQGSPARDNINRIELAATRAAELTRQMLLFSGGGPVKLSGVDLSALIPELGSLLSSVLSKRTQLSFELAPDLPLVKANPSALRQIIMNLLINASEALDGEVGAVVVRTGVREVTGEELAKTYVDWDRPGGRYCWLEISDTGAGMDDETLTRLFDPFYSTKAFGRGLGMAAVLGIIRTLEGAIEVSSEPGKGTRMKLYLPASDMLPPDEPRVQSAHTDLSLDGCVLLVDDDPTVLETTRTYLDKAGARVIEAKGGREALEQFDSHRNEITTVLLDMTMPDLSGLQVLAELRRRDIEVPVILCSGYSMKDQLTDHELQPDGFLAKPYTLPELVSAVRTLPRKS